MNKDLDDTYNQMNSFNDQLLDSSLQNYESLKDSNNNNSNSTTYKNQKASSGCPFSIETLNDPLKTHFDFHYDIGIIINPYDYLFDTLNYTSAQIKASKQILSMPKHLRNTLFIFNEKIKEIHRTEFSTLFIIAEEMKEKTNALYNKGQYQEALNQYNIIYSFYKWIELTDKEKEATLFNSPKAYDISSNPIVDSDIAIKGCRVQRNDQYEEETFKSGMTFLLKSMSYCYMHLQVYSEATKCLNEALEYYSDDSKPDIYFRRAQARLYNKNSNREQLKFAIEDIKKAIQRKKGEKMIDDHHVILKELIKTKDEIEMNIIKKLLSNFSYAYSMIKKKHLDINQTYQQNYDMNHLNYKIMKEMEESYYFRLRYYKKTNNITEYSKVITEFEAFLDDFIHYKQFYNLNITKIPKWQYDLLSNSEKEDLSLIESSPQLQGLLNDFKYKKCDEIYMNMKFNPTLLEKCFNIISDKEKIYFEPELNDNNTSVKNLISNSFKYIANLFRVKNSFQFYSGSILLLFVSMFIIISQLFIYSK